LIVISNANFTGNCNLEKLKGNSEPSCIQSTGERLQRVLRVGESQESHRAGGTAAEAAACWWTLEIAVSPLHRTCAWYKEGIPVQNLDNLDSFILLFRSSCKEVVNLLFAFAEKLLTVSVYPEIISFVFL
jgi:hypothetical protein